MENETDIFNLHLEELPQHFQTFTLNAIIELESHSSFSAEVLNALSPLPEPEIVVATAGITSAAPSKDEADGISRPIVQSFPREHLPLTSTEESKPINTSTYIPRAKYEYYPCFVDIVTAEPELKELKDDLNPIFQQFGPPLMFQVMRSETSLNTEVEGIPRFVIQLRMKMGLPGTDKRYQSLIKVLSGNSWTKLARNVHQIDSTQLFIHKHCPGVGFGIELSSISSCVRIILTSNQQENFQLLKDFYTQFLDCVSQNEDRGKYTFAMSEHCELEMRHVDAAVTPACPSNSLCFIIPSLPKMDLPGPTPAGWYCTDDPDGNKVHIKSAQ
ncbi:uncharacterized protein [Watersipora subatra]